MVVPPVLVVQQVIQVILAMRGKMGLAVRPVIQEMPVILVQAVQQEILVIQVMEVQQEILVIQGIVELMVY